MRLFCRRQPDLPLGGVAVADQIGEVVDHEGVLGSFARRLDESEVIPRGQAGTMDETRLNVGIIEAEAALPVEDEIVLRQDAGCAATVSSITAAPAV